MLNGSPNKLAILESVLSLSMPVSSFLLLKIVYLLGSDSEFTDPKMSNALFVNMPV